MTLLSIFACDNIAVPLSSGFPASELRYVLENSEAVTLLSSRKFQDKAEEILKEGLEHLQRKPVLNVVEKRRQGSGRDEVQLVPLPMNKGGMMLYTSGTTSRPVWKCSIGLLPGADILHRKASSSRKVSSRRKLNLCTKPGNTHLETICSTSFLFITSMAPLTPSSRPSSLAQPSNLCFPLMSTQSGRDWPRHS